MSSFQSCSIINPEAPDNTRLTITLPDDFHHHFRDGSKTKSALVHATQRFGRCIAMPNLKPPVTTTALATEYYKHIMSNLPVGVSSSFKPLMTLYLTDNTTPEEIRKAKETGFIHAVKYYPAGATTNSDFGVSSLQKVYPAIRAIEECGLVLCIHSEVSRSEIDIFDREKVFIEEVMTPLLKDFGEKLTIVMEHISTTAAVEFVTKGPPNLAASITAHHLLYNRNSLLVGGIKPHFYCLPILKREVHRLALLEAATSGNPKFFAGTDSAPHTTGSKESCCGCAGVYSAHAAVELYAEAFDSKGKLSLLEAFLSHYGAAHYGLEPNSSKITLVKKSWVVPKTYEFGGETVTPLRAGEAVHWSIEK